MTYSEKVVSSLSSLWDSFWEILDWPQKGKEDIAEFLLDVTEYYGLDPFHTATVISVIITLSYRKDTLNWDKQSIPEKMLVATTVCATAFFCLLSLLRIVGIIDFGSLDSPDVQAPENETSR